MKKLVFFIFISISVSLVYADEFTVINTNNSGVGSLRDALQQAAYAAGPHSITFNIPDSDDGFDASAGVWVISPGSTLPYIVQDDVTIDGTTQTANQGDTNPNGPEIVLDGNDNTINYCFSVMNAANVKIKGFNIRHFMYGIQITGTSSTNGSITGNYIGTNETATDSAGNYIGIEIISGADYTCVGGNTAEDRNIVSGNQHIGVRLVDVKYCTVMGNYVGVDRTGTMAIGNYDGVSLEGAVKFCTIGGTSPGERNLISGNVAYGLPVFGTGAEGNAIVGNYIGTDVSGSFAIPNTYGVLFDDGSFDNIIGGSSPETRNVISGNSAYGIFIYNMGTNSNVVKGNFIGTDVSGLTAVPNAVGITVDGAAYNHVIDSNVISGNLQQGIFIDITGSDSTEIVRNKIGVNVNGDPLGNGSDGIRISQGPKHSYIGGLPSEGNIIANNGGAGVHIMFDNDDYHLISCNSIYNNGGLGIDLFPAGVNSNDTGDNDTGPNEGMNFPEIDTVMFMTATSETIVQGTLDTHNPGECRIQIYKAAPDPWGHGEGKEFLATVIPDQLGFWSDTLSGLAYSDFLTTLAIDADNNTSEFSIARNSTTIAGVGAVRANDAITDIFPNPVSETVYIKTNRKVRGELRILNSIGKIVFSRNLKAGTDIITWNTNQSQGVYWVVFSQPDGYIETHKLVVAK